MGSHKEARPSHVFRRIDILLNICDILLHDCDKLVRKEEMLPPGVASWGVWFIEQS